MKILERKKISLNLQVLKIVEPLTPYVTKDLYCFHKSIFSQTREGSEKLYTFSLVSSTHLVGNRTLKKLVLLINNYLVPSEENPGYVSFDKTVGPITNSLSF